jgi:hypothetical protein
LIGFSVTKKPAFANPIPERATIEAAVEIVGYVWAGAARNGAETLLGDAQVGFVIPEKWQVLIRPTPSKSQRIAKIGFIADVESLYLLSADQNFASIKSPEKLVFE